MNEFNKNEELKYQFVLYINDHIICQRYFNIIGFDEESVDSLQIKDLMETIAGVNLGTHGSLGIIPRYLQKKSLTYMWDNYNPYSTQQEENIKGISDRKDNFQFESKVNDTGTYFDRNGNSIFFNKYSDQCWLIQIPCTPIRDYGRFYFLRDDLKMGVYSY
jgi:hypothetical protein